MYEIAEAKEGARMSSNHNPPVVLVKTWIMLLNSSESKEVRERSAAMLLGAFENDMSLVAAYCKKHNIKLK